MTALVIWPTPSITLSIIVVVVATPWLGLPGRIKALLEMERQLFTVSFEIPSLSWFYIVFLEYSIIIKHWVGWEDCDWIKRASWCQKGEGSFLLLIVIENMSDNMVIGFKNKFRINWWAQMNPTSYISDVGWNVGCIWEVSKFTEKEKRRK